jgi:glucose-6-phosphate isomerase
VENPAYLLGTLLWLADTRLGMRNHVLMPYRQGLWETAFWFRQLWAESLGKSDRVGPTPIAALGATDQHSQMQLYMEGPRDKVVIFLEVADHGEDVAIPEDAPDALAHLAGSSLGRLFDAELLGSRAALIEAGRPVLTIRLPRLDEPGMGALLQLFMVATAMAGELYGIDAFDQPGVEAGKVNAAALLGKEGQEDLASRLREAASALEEHRV